MSGGDRKPCPACGEEILAVARKCRYCGEFLDEGLKAERRRTKRSAPDGLERLSSLFILVGAPGFLVCGVGHICMAGHWDHAPYPFWHYPLEVTWPLAFLAAAVAAFGSSTASKLVRPLLVLPLIPSRLVLGSLGGGLWLLEFPALLVLMGLAVVSFVRHARAAGRSRGPTS